MNDGQRRGKGRPALGVAEKRARSISVHLTPAEWDVLFADAETRGMGMGATIRLHALEAAMRQQHDEQMIA